MLSRKHGVIGDIMAKNAIMIHIIVFETIIQFNTIQYSVILCDMIVMVYHGGYPTKSKKSESLIVQIIEIPSLCKKCSFTLNKKGS